MAEHRQEFQRELEGIEGKVIELFATEDRPWPKPVRSAPPGGAG
jgi:hypothetical protein